ncbi:MAG: hypothetical protein ACT4OS_04140 [Acidimicrobiales bacterium]
MVNDTGTVSDAERRNLFNAAENLLGPGPASTLMSLLPPAGWADVARSSDLTVTRSELRVEIADLRAEVGDLRVEVRAGFAELRADMKLQASRYYVANALMSFSTAGVVLAAVRL